MRIDTMPRPIGFGTLAGLARWQPDNVSHRTLPVALCLGEWYSGDAPARGSCKLKTPGA
jgi:hypothetical protein